MKKTVRPGLAYEVLAILVKDAFTELVPNCKWIDPEMALALMVAEIQRLRKEVASREIPEHRHLAEGSVDRTSA